MALCMQGGDLVAWRLACGNSNGVTNSTRTSPSPTGFRNGSSNHTSVVQPGLNNTRGASAALIRSSATFERFVASSRGVQNLIKSPSPTEQQPEEPNGKHVAPATSDDTALQQYHHMRAQQRADHESAPVAGQNQLHQQQQADGLTEALVRSPASLKALHSLS